MKTILTLLLLSLAPVASAHGRYDWIAKHYGEAGDKWKDGDFGGCCGKQDCFPVKADYDPKTGKWKIKDEFGGEFLDKDLDPSHDPGGEHWRCYIMEKGEAGLYKSKPRSRWANGKEKPCFFPSRGDG